MQFWNSKGLPGYITLYNIIFAVLCIQILHFIKTFGLFSLLLVYTVDVCFRRRQLKKIRATLCTKKEKETGKCGSTIIVIPMFSNNIKITGFPDIMQFRLDVQLRKKYVLNLGNWSDHNHYIFKFQACKVYRR